MNAFGTIVKGVIAGFLATTVLSVLMLSKQWLPQLDTITVMDGVARDMALAAGLPTPLAGWFWHYVVGCLVWGWMYAIMEPILPGRRAWRKGLFFGIMTTIMAWLIALPLLGVGVFGLQHSAEQHFVTLVQHLVYGWVLAIAYDELAHFGAGSR